MKIKYTLKPLFDRLLKAMVVYGVLFLPTYAFAAPATQYSSCIVSVDATRIRLQSPRPGLVSTLFQHSTGVLPGFRSVSNGITYRRCIFNALPSSVPNAANLLSVACPIATTEIDQTTNYMAFINESTEEYCLYKYDFDTTAAQFRFNLSSVSAAQAPAQGSTQAVPIFTPLGLLAMLSGLVWFGRRRRNIDNISQLNKG